MSWHYDVIDDGTTGLPDGVADTYDPWYFFAYDDGWRLLATYRGDDSNPKQQFVHHMAGMGGLGGFGGSSYIDAVILRERDANTAWASAADGTLEERRYYVQNWRADVVAIVTSAGKLVERARYSSYGIPTAFPAGDTDCDGDWDASDSTDIGLNYTPGSAYAVRRDTDLDGDVDANDVTHANSITGGYQTLGRDVLTSAAVRNRIGYAGYQYDPTFAGVDRHLFHVRHRVYDAEAGRWTRRDPLAYTDGSNLYEFCQSDPPSRFDAMGTDVTPWIAIPCPGQPTCQTTWPCGANVLKWWGVEITGGAHCPSVWAITEALKLQLANAYCGHFHFRDTSKQCPPPFFCNLATAVEISTRKIVVENYGGYISLSNYPGCKFRIMGTFECKTCKRSGDCWQYSYYPGWF